MTYKWLGAILIVISCGGFGFSFAAAQVREENFLRDLARVLDYMQCELQYRLTPLPTLCAQVANETKGSLRTLFHTLAQQLDASASSDASACMRELLSQMDDFPPQTQSALTHLANCLGRFDLAGQLKEFEAVRAECRNALDALTDNKQIRLRSYQTLGLCAGAALVILFI